MQFFVPGVPGNEAAAALERRCKACGAPKNTRPAYSIVYERDGTEVVATMGEHGVIAIIFAGQAYYIFEGLENPRSLPFESVVESVFFDDA